MRANKRWLIYCIVERLPTLNGDLDDIIQLGQLWQPVTWFTVSINRIIIIFHSNWLVLMLLLLLLWRLLLILRLHLIKMQF